MTARTAICAEHAPRAIYCIPTHQNPTAATMGEGRRREIAAVARAAKVPIIEDDAYGRLPSTPLPAIAAFAPELVWRLATTAKALSPGLRIAYVAAPDLAAARRLAEALRATTLMPAPLGAAIVTAWIREGTADKVLAAVRAEAVERQALARQILPAAQGSPEAIHIWLDTPDNTPMIAIRPPGRTASMDCASVPAPPTSTT